MTEKQLPTRRLFDEIQKDSVVLQRDAAVSCCKVGQERSVSNIKACLTSLHLNCYTKTDKHVSQTVENDIIHPSLFIKPIMFRYEKYQ